MFRKLPVFWAVALTLLVLVGCVSKNEYLQKQHEADILFRDVATLNREKQGLQENIKRLQNEISRLQALNDNLTAERNGLDARLNMLRAETNRTTEELRNRNSELEGDKSMLGESIAMLKKSKDELTSRNSALESEKQMLEESIDMLRKSKNDLMNRNVDMERDRQMLQESIDTLKKSNEELMNRNIEMESDQQILEESIAMLKESKEKEEDAGKVSATCEELIAEMKREIEQGQITVTELPGKLTVDMLDKLLFDPGRAEIKVNGSAVLKRVVKILKTVTDRTIRVEGHTDNVPIKGALAKKYPTNWELSAARALNVTRYLEKEGIDPSILSAAAFGAYRPVAGNDTPEGRAKNRRITITLLPMK